MADYVSPDQRRRIAGGLMAAQYDRATPEEGNVAQRHGLLPLANYDNGQTGLAFPGFIADPLESWGRLLRNGYTHGDSKGVEDAFNVAGAAMLGGIAAPRPANSVGALSSRIQKQIHEAQVAANPGVDPNKLAQVTRLHNGHVGVYSPAGQIEALDTGNSIRISRSLLHSAPPGQGYGSPLYDKLAEFTTGSGKRLESDDIVSPLAQGMWEHHLSKSYPVERTPGSFNFNDKLNGPEGYPVYSIEPTGNRPLPPPLPDSTLYANGGRPGAATGAALGAIPDTPGIRATNISDISTAGPLPNRILAYHGAASKFDNLDLARAPDVGLHYGTLDVTDQFSGFRDYGDKRGVRAPDNSRIYPVILDGSRMARAADGALFDETAQAHSFLDAVKKGKIEGVTNATPGFADLERNMSALPYGDASANPIVRDWLTSNGLDGVIYPNTYDGSGVSAMMWKNVRSALGNNDLLYANGGRPGATAGAALGAVPEPHPWSRLDSPASTPAKANPFPDGIKREWAPGGERVEIYTPETKPYPMGGNKFPDRSGFTDEPLAPAFELKPRSDGSGEWVWPFTEKEEALARQYGARAAQDLYANGGRLGAGLGSAFGGTSQDPALVEILRKYGLLDQNPMLSRPASPQYRPGDA